jgi:type VI secretion system protein ImpL
MLTLLKSRWFLAVIGLLLLALIVWFGGPYIAIADIKPLESVLGRIVAVLLIVVIFLLVFIMRRLLVSHNSQAIAKGAAELGDGEVKSDRGDRSRSGADEQQLAKRFAEAAAALRASKKSGHSLYELPWYIIIGPPGAGKTTILQNCGLNFPLRDTFGKHAVRGVGGTRNCDWWFTDEAIFLDTAGRYTTQDSGSRSDAAGWAAFLELLRKYRKRQPINGVILGISAADLLTMSSTEREGHVSAIRARLEELNQQLRITPPVYVLVTKCDLIAGFSEYFDEFGKDARSQVWGMTFGLEVSESGRAAESLKREFDLLLERIQGRMISRLEQERDLRRRVSILAFPQQLSGLRSVLDDFLRAAFGGTGFDSRVMLRGVYLTSGTQEGTPIDRMLAAISRSFGVSAAVPAAPAGQGKSFFIERLLRQVIFQESGLAGVNRRQLLRKVLLQSGAYISCLVALVVIAGLLFLSYRANAKYIDDVSAASEALTQVPVPQPGTPVEGFLPYLDALRAVADAAEVHREHVPLDMRMGLYRGRALGGAAREAYAHEVNQLLLPVLGQRFEQRIAASSRNPDQLYEVLKAYLMLTDASHRDAAHLRFLADIEWRGMFPRDPESRQRIADHFETLLKDPAHFETLALDADAVSRARYALQTASLPVLMYSRLKLNYVGDQKRALRLDLKLGPDAEAAFYRNSGAKVSDPLPAIYTRPVFNEISSTGKLLLVKQFAEDRWVFGDKVFDLANVPRVAYQVMQVYEQDYIRFWDAMIADMRLRSSPGQLQLSAMLGLISGPSSPLKGFVQVVADNTDLLKPDDSLAGKAAGTAEAAAGAVTGGLSKVFGDDIPAGADKAGTAVSVHFEPIRRLVDGPPGGAPIDRVMAALAQINQVLKTAGGGVGAQSTADPSVLKAAGDAQQAVAQESRQLPPAIATMVMDVGGQGLTVVKGEASGELGRKYDEFVAKECRELIEGRYPFSRGSTIDVRVDDFAHVFGDGGTFDKFYRENLAPLVDTSRSVWRWKEGAAEPTGAHGMLQQFQEVERIREVYFSSGAKPQVRFTMTPDALDKTATRVTVEVDGQVLDYQNGRLQGKEYAWPGNAVGSSSVTFESADHTVPLAFQGPWAWFRLLDTAKIQVQSDTRFLVTFTQGSHWARFVIDASSVRNPFANGSLQTFRCGT